MASHARQAQPTSRSHSPIEERPRPPLKRRRISSSAEDMQAAINQPGSIKINVTGAYIIDHEDEDVASSSTGSSPSNESGPIHPSLDEQPTYHKRDIRLPNHTSVVSHVAADIGGSLAKVVYFSRETGPTESGGRLHFVSFETDKIDDCIEYLRHLQGQYRATNRLRAAPDLSVQATGGGAYKFYNRIKERLNVQVQREDEMECLIAGLDFFITEIPMEVFTYDDTDPEDAVHYQDASRDVYPYLLVNIGSGVSMIKVSSPSQFQRIGGTSLGGGTLWGLLSLLTGARTFDDMLALADQGDNSAVDLLVGDIYGEGMGYEKIGLKENTIASSFGKVLKRKREAERSDVDKKHSRDLEGTSTNGITNGVTNGIIGGDMDQAGSYMPRPSILTKKDSDQGSALIGDDRVFKPADVSRSLLYAVSNNIGQIAYLQSEKHDIKRVYFGGSFIRGHRQTIHTLSYAIRFWSKGLKQAYFLRHEGYLGAVGAFMKRRPAGWSRRGSFDSARP